MSAKLVAAYVPYSNKPSRARLMSVTFLANAVSELLEPMHSALMPNFGDAFSIADRALTEFSTRLLLFEYPLFLEQALW